MLGIMLMSTLRLGRPSLKLVSLYSSSLLIISRELFLGLSGVKGWSAGFCDAFSYPKFFLAIYSQNVKQESFGIIFSIKR